MSSPSSTKSRTRQYRPMARIGAALVAVAATALALTACGASVSGSPQPNAAAVTSAESTTTSADATTTRSTPTSDDESTTSRASRPTAPTDLTDLTELTELTDVSIPTDLTELTDLSIPTDLGDIPGFSGACASVSFAYLAVVLGPLSSLDPSGEYDAAELQKSLDELNASSEIPPELAADFQALGEVAQEANGKSIEQAGELFGSEKFTTASDNISKWLDGNCAG